ncbi:MAG: gluconate 2-dehydrogenase subunit 3 family protein [Sulfurovum sp.]|nr:gluconate 2-dehydrogenase subunit 3 family protein [Sulfurovum sp.]MCB4774182.1 gluconate 2-dehydrogenase subunit 3 family protein [Sulfurovum sp.]
MKRRTFMVFGSLVGIPMPLSLKAHSTSTQQKEFIQVRETIAAVQAHMFPEGGKLPSAKRMHTITFTEETIFHATYDKDIRAFVIDGARELMGRERGEFLAYNALQKEKALRSYESTAYGSSWLARIMVLTMEALFSDPIYGSNTKLFGWRAINSFGGKPRPKTRYIDL